MPVSQAALVRRLERIKQLATDLGHLNDGDESREGLAHAIRRDADAVIRAIRASIAVR